ncbi:ExbD/TolR family protein [Pelomicrobium methylotrophicum]|uniref:Biopolymer transporter ExbD n=1 Tax=Pelomicrobium methylotrophicum TaxID=2602750 RepID=A0A5C7ETU0_9PROT|nr:biopolymer transporter ExbD [Pelomicrobium methylotrophicum]TXF11394.1 hypothetical protein FR698_10885 [Pelomicrobium methylotrophicum]
MQLGIRSTGDVFWNGEPVNRPALERRLEDAARLQPQPELHLRADASSEYRQVAEVLSLAAKAGLTLVGLVTDPKEP